MLTKRTLNPRRIKYVMGVMVYGKERENNKKDV